MRFDSAQLKRLKDIDTLKHLVRKYPQEAMKCLTFNQMLEYILSHKNIGINLEEAKAELATKEV